MEERNENTPWYQCWFNTPYYHILYKDRNEEEARLFLDNLFSYLSLPAKASVWDMACGKGRHAIYIAQKGFDSFGTDISPNSIEEAGKCAAGKGAHASFFVHDMRGPLRINYFDCVLNIFTSLGYFETRRDDERVLQSAFQACRSGRYFVVDFMNAVKTLNNLVAEEEKLVDGILFKIRRKLERGAFMKEINFFAEGRQFNYTEKVRAYTKDDLLAMAQTAGFSLINTFGNYKLENFNENQSDRLILLLKKSSPII
jgi:SAM-dependent methyltransferase